MKIHYLTLPLYQTKSGKYKVLCGKLLSYTRAVYNRDVFINCRSCFYIAHAKKT